MERPSTEVFPIRSTGNRGLSYTVAGLGTSHMGVFRDVDNVGQWGAVRGPGVEDACGFQGKPAAETAKSERRAACRSSRVVKGEGREQRTQGLTGAERAERRNKMQLLSVEAVGTT